MLIPTDVLLLFILASLALAVVPGPDYLFVLSQSALYGRRSGLLVTLGLCIGLLLHIAAATLGVAAIFQTSLLAFNLFKAAGAAHLGFLAVQALKASAAGLEVGPLSGFDARELCFRGIIMESPIPRWRCFFSRFASVHVRHARLSGPANAIARKLFHGFDLDRFWGCRLLCWISW